MAEFKEMTFKAIDSLLKSDIGTMTPRLIEFLEVVHETRRIKEVANEVNLLLNILSCHDIQNKRLLFLMRKTRLYMMDLYKKGFFKENDLDRERFKIFSRNITDVYSRLDQK